MKHLERALNNQNQWWKILLVFLGVVGSLLLVSVLADILETFFGWSFPDIIIIGVSSFVFFLVTSVFIRDLHKRNFKEVINGTQSVRWKRMFFGMAAWGGIMALTIVADYYNNPDNFIVNFDLKTLIPLIFLAILIFPVQAGFEEFLFRGYLAQIFGAWTKNRWAAVIFPTILFGLMHSANPEVVRYGFWPMMTQYMCIGFIFGIVSILDDGIELAMGAHIINNIFGLAFLSFEDSVIETSDALLYAKTMEIPSVLSTVIGMTFIGAIFIGILKSKYKWKFSILNLKIEKSKIEESELV